MSDALDMLPAEARRELARLIRDHEIPMDQRPLVSLVFAIGYGVGVEVTAARVVADARSVVERCDELTRRVEALGA